MNSKQPAIILLGPTGSGKTPLGMLLEERGWHGRECVHFDFGDNLRRCVAADRPDAILSADDIEFLRGVLRSGALLEDDDFPIAQRLLVSFLQSRGAGTEKVVVMNGLPRHAGQADALGGLLDVVQVIVLECPAEVVRERIVSNAGGDRSERVDDDIAAIHRKLQIYRQRTEPLVDFFRKCGVPVTTLPVTATMDAGEMWSLI